MQPLQTEIEFELPLGYVDDTGTLHRAVTMRRATAADEIFPMEDPRVQDNQAYMAVILLSRVVTRIGSIASIDTDVIESLYVQDFEFLQAKYNELNYPEASSPEGG